MNIEISKMELNVIHEGDAKQGLKLLPEKAVNCCVTSPPYFGKRNYEVKGQIGLEKDPDEYIHNLVQIFNGVHRVLMDDGTLWLNIGDSYATGGRGYGGRKHQSKNTYNENMGWRSAPRVLKHKDLIGIPWKLAFALRDAGAADIKSCRVLETVMDRLILQYAEEVIPDKVIYVLEDLQREYSEAKGSSWYLRQDIIWYKPNGMPESVTDRCTSAHEYIFLLTKKPKYFYNAEAISTEVKDSTVKRLLQDVENQKGSDRLPGKVNGPMKAIYPGRKPRKGVDTRGGNQGNEHGIPPMAINGAGVTGHSGYFDNDGILLGNGRANKRSVWSINTQPFREAHFATFPDKVPRTCIKAGCPSGGVVLDVFMGSGKTAIEARKLGMNYIGYELNRNYIALANQQIIKKLGLFA